MSMFSRNTIIILFIKEVCIINALASAIVFLGRHPSIGIEYISIPVPYDSVSRRGPRLHVRENDLYAPACPL